MSTGQLPQLVARGDRLMAKGSPAAAIKVWRGFLANNQDLESPLVDAVKQRMGRAYYQRSRAFLRGKPTAQAMARALAALQEAVQWDAASARYAHELGMCRYRMGDLAGAAADLARGLDLDGAAPETRYYCVLARLRQGDPSGALDLLTAPEAAAENSIPRWGWARLRALALAALGRPEEALEPLDPATTPPEIWWADVLDLSRSVEPAAWLRDWLAEQYQVLAENGFPGEATKVAGLLGDVCEALGRMEEADQYRRAAGGASVVKLLAAYEEQALAALAGGDHAPAVRACRQALELKPGEPVMTDLLATAELLAGNAQWQEGRRQEAGDTWRRSFETRKSAAAAGNLALVHESAEEWREAGEWWRQAGELARAAGDAHVRALSAVHRGIALARQGKAGEAVNALRQVRELPADATLGRIQGFICLLGGDLEGARAAFEAAHGQHPGDPQLALGWALAVDLGGRPPGEKAEGWKRAMVLRPDPETAARWRQHSLEVGINAWKAGNWKEAMQTFAALLLQDREDADGWIWCGLLHLQQGNEAAAKDCLDEAVRVRPGSAETLVKVGGCQLLVGRREEARAYFDRALELDPTAATELLIAETCLENKWPELAFERLQAGLRQCDAGARELPLILRLVIRIGDVGKTLTVLDDALEVTSGSPRVHLLVAVQHIRAGAWRRAQEALDRIPADGGGDQILATAAVQLSQALILLRTVGSTDQRQFEGAVGSILDSWMLEKSPPEPEPARKWQAWAREELEAILQGIAATEVSPAGAELPSPRLQAEAIRFGQPLDVEEWLARGRLASA